MEGVEYEAEVYNVRGELPRWEQTKMRKAQDVIKKKHNRAKEGTSCLLNKKEIGEVVHSQGIWPEGSGRNEAAACVSVRQHKATQGSTPSSVGKIRSVHGFRVSYVIYQT